MANVLFTNLAGGTLLSPITSGATSLTLNSGQGALFPNPTGTQFFPLVLQSASNSALVEITYCTARSGDTLTVTRAEEGTAASAFNAGDLAQCRVTAGTLELLADWFPSSFPTVTTSASITQAVYQGAYIQVGGSATTQTVPVASTVPGMVVGFTASTAFTLASAGGYFVGGLFNGANISLKAGDYIAIQSDGTSWRIFSANSTLGQPPSVLTLPWLRYNSDNTIEQGGTTAVLNHNQTQTITLAHAYAGNIIDLQATPIVQSGTENDQSASGYVVNNGTITVSNTGSNGSITFAIRWRTLGY